MRKRSTFFTLYFIYFLDLAGIALIYVLFTPLIIAPESGMLPKEVPLSTRNLILGVLFAAYPFAQFIGAPILGELSDRFGRRPTLLFSTIGTTAAYVLSAAAILLKALPLLIISRVLAGVTAGNMTVAQAAVADLTAEKIRPRYMAAFTVTGGMAWVIAPYVGVFLAHSKIFPHLNDSTPFLVMALLFLYTFGFVAFKFQETHLVTKKSSLHVLHIFQELLAVLKIHKISALLILSVISIVGWMMYQGFMSPFLEERFKLKEKGIGHIFAYFSLWWVLGGVLANRWLLKKFSPAKANILPLFLVPMTIFSYLIFRDLSWVWFASGLANLAQAISISCFFALFSILASKGVQGKVFGFWNAGFALASALSPLLVGWFSSYQIFLPFTLAAIILSGCALFYFRLYLRKL